MGSDHMTTDKQDGHPMQVIVFPRGQLRPNDKRALKEAGWIAVEADDPKSVVKVLAIAPCAPLASPDDIGMAALKAVKVDSQVRANFAAHLIQAIEQSKAIKP